MLIKRLKICLAGISITGLLMLGCEKMNGPEPFLSSPLPGNQLLFLSPAGAPLHEPISLNSTQFLTINDLGVWAILQPDVSVEPKGVLMTDLGKITFQ